MDPQDAVKQSVEGLPKVEETEEPIVKKARKLASASDDESSDEEVKQEEDDFNEAEAASEVADKHRVKSLAEVRSKSLMQTNKGSSIASVFR